MGAISWDREHRSSWYRPYSHWILSMTKSLANWILTYRKTYDWYCVKLLLRSRCWILISRYIKENLALRTSGHPTIRRHAGFDHKLQSLRFSRFGFAMMRRWRYVYEHLYCQRQQPNPMKLSSIGFGGEKPYPLTIEAEQDPERNLPLSADNSAVRRCSRAIFFTL